jgi:hypothetical protein
VSGPDLYAAGGFVNAGGNPSADFIARWDGSAWQAMGSSFNNMVYPILVVGPELYIGGNFTNAGGNDNADRIVRLGPNFPVFLPSVRR